MRHVRKRYAPLLWGALTVTVIMFSVVFAIADESDKKKAAVGAARDWLDLVDGGSYAKSYSEASEYFKNAVTKDQWEQAMNAVRQPLGELISRKVISTTYATSLPGAPDGEYVVILFETSFENKKEAIETIYPMIDKDKTWRVTEYFIK